MSAEASNIQQLNFHGFWGKKKNGAPCRVCIGKTSRGVPLACQCSSRFALAVSGRLTVIMSSMWPVSSLVICVETPHWNAMDEWQVGDLMPRRFEQGVSGAEPRPIDSCLNKTFCDEVIVNVVDGCLLGIWPSLNDNSTYKLKSERALASQWHTFRICQCHPAVRSVS